MLYLRLGWFPWMRVITWSISWGGGWVFTGVLWWVLGVETDLKNGRRREGESHVVATRAKSLKHVWWPWVVLLDGSRWCCLMGLAGLLDNNSGFSGWCAVGWGWERWEGESNGCAVGYAMGWGRWLVVPWLEANGWRLVVLVGWGLWLYGSMEAWVVKSSGWWE